MCKGYTRHVVSCLVLQIVLWFPIGTLFGSFLVAVLTMLSILTSVYNYCKCQSAWNAIELGLSLLPFMPVLQFLLTIMMIWDCIDEFAQ